jgi:hypothetical protein
MRLNTREIIALIIVSILASAYAFWIGPQPGM